MDGLYGWPVVKAINGCRPTATNKCECCETLKQCCETLKTVLCEGFYIRIFYPEKSIHPFTKRSFFAEFQWVGV